MNRLLQERYLLSALLIAGVLWALGPGIGPAGTIQTAAGSAATSARFAGSDDPAVSDTGLSSTVFTSATSDVVPSDVTTWEPQSFRASIDWDTLIGDDGSTCEGRIAVRGNGEIYVTGRVGRPWGEPIRPFTPGATPSNESDDFVAKMDPNGNVIWHTFLGGDGVEYSGDITVDEDGNAYVTGDSSAAWSCLSSPCTIRPYSEGTITFVAKLDPDGVLLWNTFLGSHSSDSTTGITWADGYVYVTGATRENWGSPLRPYTRSSDALVVKLDGDGYVIWNTYLGGSSADHGNDIATDRFGNIYVAGSSKNGWSCDPTPPSCMVRPYVGSDAFVAKFDPNGALLWNSFLGGGRTDEGLGIVVDDRDHLYVAGISEGTWGSPVRAFTEGEYYEYWTDDVFAAQLDSNGNLIWNTFLGSTYWEDGARIAVDGRGHAFVVGYGEDDWEAPGSQYLGSIDTFVAELGVDGDLLQNLYLGGAYDELSRDVVMAANGHVLVCGEAGKVFVAQLSPTYATMWMQFTTGD